MLVMPCLLNPSENCSKAAIKALDEASDPNESQRIRESLAWQRKIYLTVYDAWVALGCLDAPDDNPDPTFDPSSAMDFDEDKW